MSGYVTNEKYVETIKMIISMVKNDTPKEEIIKRLEEVIADLKK